MTAVSEVRYWWHEVPVPAGLAITQVYGWLLCPQTGRVLIQDDDGVFNLPGGTPEPEDADLVATLVREAFEENQVRVGVTAYLGYQEVRRPGRAQYAQVRMADQSVRAGRRRYPPKPDRRQKGRRVLPGGPSRVLRRGGEKPGRTAQARGPSRPEDH